MAQTPCRYFDSADCVDNRQTSLRNRHWKKKNAACKEKKTKRMGKLMKSVLLHEIIKNYAAKCFVN